MGANPQAGQQLEHSGDEEVYSGDLASAKHRYGAAIDAYLEERLYDAAIRTCRKLIRVAPDVVRTYYTLAYLLVGERRHSEACDALRDYSQAVQDTGMQGYAVPLLTLLAYATEDADVRDCIGRAVNEVSAPGDRLQWPEYEQLLRHVSIAGASPRERWERLLPIALRDA